MALKEIKAYVTSDDKKFFEKPEAQMHEDWLKYQTKKVKIKNYLLGLLGGIKSDPEDGDEEDYQFSALNHLRYIEKVSSQCRSASFLREMDIEDLVEIIMDITTAVDGTLLKTIKYAEEILL